jgi:hypothetical protein
VFIYDEKETLPEPLGKLCLTAVIALPMLLATADSRIRDVKRMRKYGEPKSI